MKIATQVTVPGSGIPLTVSCSLGRHRGLEGPGVCVKTDLGLRHTGKAECLPWRLFGDCGPDGTLILNIYPPGL